MIVCAVSYCAVILMQTDARHAQPLIEMVGNAGEQN